MGLVKTVGCELQDEVVDSNGHLFAMPVLQAALNKTLLLLLENLFFLFPDGPPQQVCLAEGKAGHFSRDLHDLLLVDDHPVSFL